MVKSKICQVCKHNIEFMKFYVVLSSMYMINNHCTVYIMQVIYDKACTNPKHQVTVVHRFVYMC
jgi:hypothetical protein